MNKYKYPLNLLKGAQQTVEKIVDTVHFVDTVIQDWSDQLNRAQPLLSGRLVVRFSPTHKVVIDGKTLRDVVPKFGQMIKLKTGGWKFKWLEGNQLEQKPSNFRVGRSFPSDRVVVRLIDGIEDMMKHREKLVEKLTVLRASTPNQISASESAVGERLQELEKLKTRIKLDWYQDANGAFEAIRKRDRTKNEARVIKSLGH